MKKLRKIVALICTAATMAASCSAFAYTQGKDNGKIDVNINGTYLDFDVDPIMQNDRVMLPMRKIFETLGASVDWDESTQTVTAQKDGTIVKLTVNSSNMLVNGSTVTLDAPAIITGGRTLVPVRAVSEALGASVSWFGHGHDIVTISTYPITCEDAIQIVRDIYKGYPWYTAEDIDALNLEICDIYYVKNRDQMAYHIWHNWGLTDEEGNELSGSHSISVNTGEVVSVSG